jgi:hypothetical protein
VSDLRESLDEALRTVIAGDPPVGEAIRRGKAIRRKRRAGAVAAVASVAMFAVFAVVGYPALAHRQAGPATTAPGRGHATVTDVPPGRGAPAGLIASGTIKGQDWRVVTDPPGSNGAPGQQCFGAFGPAFGQSAAPLTQCLAVPGPTTAAPVELLTFAASTRAQAIVGRVGAEVSRVAVRLADGTELKLVPVTVYGIRYVAFAAPLSPAVDSVTAYLANGQYLTAAAFPAPGAWTFFGVWLAPGQTGLPRITRRIAAGSTGGRAWSVTVYSGPWGICLDEVPAVNVECMPVASPLGTSAQRSVGEPPGVVWGPAGLDVSYVVVTLTDGATLRAPAVRAGDQDFFAVVLRNGQTPRRWAAYDAARAEVCSGKF